MTSVLEQARVAAVQFHRVCDADDLWAGETKLVAVAGIKVLLVHTDDGELSAVQATCPHQGVALADAELCGRVLTCPMHLWEMDAVSGKGVNPGHAELALYPVEMRDDGIYVGVDGVTPKSAKP